MKGIKPHRLFAALAVLSLLNLPAQAATACDLAVGQKAFETKCSICHALAEHKVGPALAGIVGRKAGSVAGFGYTPALEVANFTWDAEHLDAFLNNPLTYLPGTAMAFGGLHQAEVRRALICFLGQTRDKS